MKETFEKLKESIEIPNENIDKYVLTIKGSDYDLNRWKRVKEYDYNGFVLEGLPTAIIASRLAGKEFSKYSISRVYYTLAEEEPECIITRGLREFDDKCVTLTRGGVAYDVGLIPNEVAKEIVRKFLLGESYGIYPSVIYPGGEFSEEFNERALNELFPTLVDVKASETGVTKK